MLTRGTKAKITEYGVYIEGDLVWENPSGPYFICQRIEADDDEVWVDEELVWSRHRKVKPPRKKNWCNRAILVIFYAWNILVLISLTMILIRFFL